MKKKSLLHSFSNGRKCKKLSLIMRLSLILILAAVFNATASVYSQSVRVDLKLKNATLEEVFQAIQDQSEFDFFYKNEILSSQKSISKTFNNAKIEEVLDNVLEGTGLTYRVLDKDIVVKKEEPSDSRNQLQSITISGKIVDENNQGLPGVNVIVKGTAQGTVTDVEGNYSLEVPDEESILVFSSVGYVKEEVTVGTNTIIDMALSQDITALEEIVVIGYGTMKKSDLTGSLVRVNTNKTADLRNANILQSLKGNVAGLSVGTPDRAGEEPSFKVRGTNSISAGNRPLVVVDGIIYWGSLSSFDVNDIESIDVLKDASAAAVYGSRSANGVIIITTKKGVSEKPEFNFSGSYGMSNPMSLIPVLDPDQYLQKMLDYRIATGQEAIPGNIHDYLTITESNNLTAGKTIDWYDRLVEPAATQNYTGSVSGRTDKTNYYLSGAYFNQGGIVKNDDFERITARANFSNTITDWFKVSLKSSFSHLDYSGIAVPLSYALSPYSNWYEGGADSGNLEEFPMEDPYFRHPYMSLGIDNKDVTNDLWGLISSEIKIPWIDGLKWTLNYSINHRSRRLYRFDDNTLAQTQNGSAYKEINDFYTWTFDNIISYNKTFNDLHAVDATLLFSREYQANDATRASSTNFFSQATGYNSLELGAVPLVSSGFGEQNQTAIMGRINYIYNNKYAITGTVRRDGFSGFAEGNKYATFYSGAFAWTMSNEAFLQDISWIDRLKLRLSYGENGNQAIGRYQTLARMSSGANYVFGDGGGTSNGVYVSTMANNDLGWEMTKVVNLGLDFDLFKNALYGSIDVYSSNTEDLLLRRNIPSLTGYTTVWTNIGSVHNEGVEIALNSRAIDANDFTWDIGFIFDLNRNSIESLFGVDDDGDGIEDDDIANSWFIGEPLGVYYGYGIDGIHQTDESDIPSGYEPGDFRIVDYDGDGELTAEDRYILGYNIPNYQFSISNTFQFKNWSLYAMVNSIQGGGNNNYYMGNNLHGHNPTAQFSSWSERFSFPVMDYWTPTNPSNTASRINYQPTRAHVYLEDRSFVRIQDVILSYTFDNELMNKWNMAGLRVFASGKNLYTFTNWTGYDPENATTITGYPMLRTFTFGVDLKF